MAVPSITYTTSSLLDISQNGTMSPRPSNDIEAHADKSYVDNVEVVANADRPNARKEAPAYVASLTPEEREQAEKALVRKIDLRLLPMIIIMYILNYLDRNNIVSSLACSSVYASSLYSRLRLVWQVSKKILVLLETNIW